MTDEVGGLRRDDAREIAEGAPTEWQPVPGTNTCRKTGERCLSGCDAWTCKAAQPSPSAVGVEKQQGAAPEAHGDLVDALNVIAKSQQDFGLLYEEGCADAARLYEALHQAGFRIVPAANAAVPPSQSVGVDAGSADALDLSGIEARWAHVTPDWKWQQIDAEDKCVIEAFNSRLGEFTGPNCYRNSLAAFHARTDIPALIAALNSESQRADSERRRADELLAIARRALVAAAQHAMGPSQHRHFCDLKKQLAALTPREGEDLGMNLDSGAAR